MRGSILLTLISIFAASSALSAQPSFSSQQLASLKQGEVLLQPYDQQRSGVSVRVSLLIKAPAQSIWGVITSCESSYVYVKGIRQCEVLEETATMARFTQQVKVSWITPRYDYLIEAQRQPYTKIHFHQVEGDLERMEGSWYFQEVDVQTTEGGSDTVILLTHELSVKTHLPVPKWLVRRTMRKDLPDMMRCVRGMVGGSVQPEQASVDKQSCPKPKRKTRHKDA